MQCHEIFRHFFHESYPPGSLINRLKGFLLKISFRGDIGKISDYGQANNARSRLCSGLTMHGVGSAQANSARRKTTRRLTLHGVGLRAGYNCTEFCRCQFFLCRRLLTLKENSNFFSVHVNELNMGRAGNLLILSERIARFLRKNERMSNSLKKRAICSSAHFW